MPIDAGMIFAEVRKEINRLTAYAWIVQKSFDLFSRDNEERIRKISKPWIVGIKREEYKQIAAFAIVCVAVKKSAEFYINLDNSEIGIRAKASRDADMLKPGELLSRFFKTVLKKEESA